MTALSGSRCGASGSGTPPANRSSPSARWNGCSGNGSPTPTRGCSTGAAWRSVNKGVERFTIERIKPSLRAELDRRILASASLIRLNRDAAIEKTIQRFQGWATSIPKGGSGAVAKRETKDDIRKSLAQLPFEERRVLIDQGHKLTSSISEILATDGGAIAGVWRSHWRQSGYDYRVDHKDRDEKVYTVRDNWAMQAGLMKVGRAGYTDDITKPGEEVFCRCYYSYLYHLRDLPASMLTAKGRAQLERVRQGAAA